MKKGQTESYSFLIGIIIAFLILTAIGCAVYNMYKPQGAKYFDKLVKQLERLEKVGEDIGDAEMTFFIEKDKVLVGFNAQEKKKEIKKSLWGWLSGRSCYGINLGKYLSSIIGIESGLERPSECPLDESCLCLCELKKSIDIITLVSFTLPANVLYIHPQACKGMGVKCKSFEELELVGGKGCPYGVLIPGQKMVGDKTKERGLMVLHYSYSKEGKVVSLDDIAPLSKEELEGKIDEEKEKAAEDTP